MTFKEAEAAKKACEDATPVINGRRANCNLASLGARRPRSLSTTPPAQHGMSIYIFTTFAIPIMVIVMYFQGNNQCFLSKIIVEEINNILQLVKPNFFYVGNSLQLGQPD